MTQRHYPFGNEVKETLKQRLPPPVTVEIRPLGRCSALGRIRQDMAAARHNS